MGDMANWIIGAKEIVTALVALVGALAVIYGWVIRPFKKQAELDREQGRKIDDLIASVNELKKQVDEHQTEYVRDRLQTMHERYVNELGWASAEEKRRIVDWYDAYRAKGYNHLSQTYAQDIMSLPEKAPGRSHSGD